MRTSCCYPTTSNFQVSKASLIPTKPPHVSLAKNEGWWRRKCVVIGVASCCTIIGLELSNSVTILGHEAVAHREDQMVFVTVSNSMGEIEEVSNNSVGGVKWSEKRACQPWRGSSLETIVPENLPRPAARRRYEAVRSTSKTAPPLSLPIKLKTNRDNCFSM